VKCDDFLVTSEDKRSCIEPSCSKRWKVGEKGCEPCEKYQIVSSEDKKVCVQPVCSSDKYVGEDGECKKCDPYTSQALDKTSCANMCPADKKANEDGSCSKCEEGE